MYEEDKIKEIYESDKKNILRLREELKKYDLFDFLARVSSLMLVPNNQSKSVIFQCMISTAISIPKDEIIFKNKMSSGKFRYFVNEFSNLNRKKMIDPAEFPFVLPVNYYGNYNIFMGASSLSPMNLNQMLKLVNVYHNKLSGDKYKKLNNIIFGFIKLSDTIFKKLNIEFDNMHSYNKDDEICIPSSNIIDKHSQFVQLSDDEMLELFGERYEELFISFGDIDCNEIVDFDNQRFYNQPFISHGNKNLILDVTAIIYLLMDKIIKTFMELDNFNVINEYNKLLIADTEKSFVKLGNLEIASGSFDLDLINSCDANEKIYTMGNDGVIYNLTIFDSGIDYGISKKYKNKFDISSRIDEVRKKINNQGIDNEKIIIIITPTTIGRNMSYKYLVAEEDSIITLSQYELHVIAVNEGISPLFMYRYLKSRKRIGDYKRLLFSELNTIALYVQQGYSFYIGDDIDIKDTSLTFIGEYSSDYILKSYIKEGLHLAKYKDTGILVEVEKNDDNSYFSPSLLFGEDQLNSLIEVNKFNVWILSNENLNANTIPALELVMGMLSYWLPHFKQVFNNINGVFIIYLCCSEKFSSIHQIEKRSEPISFKITDNVLHIAFGDNSLLNFESSECDYEKEFICTILNYICNYFNIKMPEDIIKNAFMDRNKRRLVSTSLVDESYMLPFETPETIKVNQSDINMILDDIGLYVKNDLHVTYGKIEDYKVLNSIVEHLYKSLIDRLKKYKKGSLLKFLCLQYEKNLTLLHNSQVGYINNVACFPEKLDKIEMNCNILNRTSVAIKALIEFVSAIKFDGDMDISLYEIEYCLAIATQIIETATICDTIHYKMAKKSLVLLKSNRIGVDHTEINKINDALQTSIYNQMNVVSVNRVDRFQINEADNLNENLEFHCAFEDEFGFTFNEYADVVISMLELAECKNRELDDIFETNLEEISKLINNRIDRVTIEKIISYLSLEEREEFLIPPPGYEKYDCYPWRNNRGISYSRKPIIKYKDKLIFGFRTLYNSVHFLLGIINNGTLKAHSYKMKNYIASITNKRGEDFNTFVYDSLKKRADLLVDKKVNKINGKQIRDTKKNKLGDIDVLVISGKNKTITAVEVKNFLLSRNMYEIHQEYTKMFDTSDPKSYFNKHMRRVEWCKNHISDIIEHYNLKQCKWKIDYCFIVSNPLVSNNALDVREKVYTMEEIDSHL